MRTPSTSSTSSTWGGQKAGLRNNRETGSADWAASTAFQTAGLPTALNYGMIMHPVQTCTVKFAKAARANNANITRALVSP